MEPMSQEELIDHLNEYMRERAQRFVENMDDHYPTELLDIKANHPDRLINLLTEGATPKLRMMEDIALDSAMARLLVSIRWAQRKAEGTKTPT